MGAVAVSIMVAVPANTAGAGPVVMMANTARPHPGRSWFRRILHRVHVDTAVTAAHMAAVHTSGADVVDVLVVASVALPHVVSSAHVDGSCC